MSNSKFQVPLQALQVKQVGSISPSSFTSFGECLLRSACRAARSPELLPSPQNSRLGTVAHQLLEEAGRGRINTSNAEERARFLLRWDELVADQERQMVGDFLQKRFVPLSKSILKYEVIRHSSAQKALELARPRRSKDNGHTEVNTKGDDAEDSVFYERRVETPDGKVRGTIDFWQETPQGAILRDYKAGAIWKEETPEPNSVVKTEYQTQLRIYAALYHSTTGQWPWRLEVAPLAGPNTEVSFSADEATDLLEEAKALLIHSNARIDSAMKTNDVEDLAAPSPRICRRCPFRPGCSAYWKARKESDAIDWPHDICGTIISKSKLGNGKASVKLQTSDESSVSITLSANYQQQEQLDESQVGDLCAFYSLQPRYGTKEAFTETMFTIAYFNSPSESLQNR